MLTASTVMDDRCDIEPRLPLTTVIFLVLCLLILGMLTSIFWANQLSVLENGC